MPLPYENATSGRAAIEEMRKILAGFGASSFGCMEDFEKGEILVQFAHRGRTIQVTVNTKGYAAAWLALHPYNHRTKGTRTEYQKRALKIGQTAGYSILRDWIKGQITAVEVGMLSFEGAFLGQILLPTGETVLERVTANKMLAIGDT